MIPGWLRLDRRHRGAAVVCGRYRAATSRRIPREFGRKPSKKAAPETVARTLRRHRALPRPSFAASPVQPWALFLSNGGSGSLAVTNLYVKRKHGAGLEAVTKIAFDQRGIRDGVPCAPFRQVLIASRSGIAACGLKLGDLRENIVVDYDALYELPSGTVLRIGQALIRLTFHCEPCKKILHLVEFDKIVHRRGVFGNFLNDGSIAVGDDFAVTEQKFEEIPYAVNERIRWFIKKHGAPAAAWHLIHEIGLPPGYARAMPRLLAKLLFGMPAPSGAVPEQ
jgi:hypothetical protein